jgi:hypothetical protein
MPLSEHEQRLLDEMERNLYGTDSDVHAAPLGGMPRPNYRAIVAGVVIIAVGLAVLLGGVMSHLILAGIAGFAVMFAGVLIASRPGTPREFPASGAGRQSSRNKATFMQRMEARWEQRDDGR